MSKSNSTAGSFWLLLLLLGAGYIYFRFWVPPTMEGTPTLVTVRQLLTQPERYQNQLVMLTDGHVFGSYFLLERCGFQITDTERTGTLVGTSARYHPVGDKLKDAVFKCEILYCDQNQSMLMLREVVSQ